MTYDAIEYSCLHGVTSKKRELTLLSIVLLHTATMCAKPRLQTVASYRAAVQNKYGIQSTY
jgi:hypothetical protein